MKYLLLLMIFQSTLLFSQEKITGKVINYNTNEILPYVNIGIINNNTGTISDSDGNYMLTISQNTSPNEIVTISCIGFKTKKYKISELHENTLIKLKPETHYLDEVLVHSNSRNKRNKEEILKIKKIGRSNKLLAFFHNFFHLYDENKPDNLGRERGMIFKLENNSKIESFNFHISSNEYKLIKFRLHFYKMEKGLPTSILNVQNITFEVLNQYRGWYSLDLKKYNLIFDENIEEIGVTLQWIDSEKMDEETRFFSFSAALASTPRHLERNEVMGRWKINKYKLNMYLEYTLVN